MRERLLVLYVGLIALLIAPSALAIGGWQGTAVENAAKNVGFAKSDAIETKIAKAICYLDRKKLYKADPPPVGNDASYGLDTRTAEAVLEQMPLKKGGSCGSYAVSVASLLMYAGVPEDDLRIVMAGENSAIKTICPFADQPMRTDAHGQPIANGLSGHVFVLYRSGSVWKLANTTNAECKTLRPDVLEFFNPVQMVAQMRAGPLSVPPFRNLQSATFQDERTGKAMLAFPQGLTIVGAWTPRDYPEHNFRRSLQFACERKQKFKYLSLWRQANCRSMGIGGAK